MDPWILKTFANKCANLPEEWKIAIVSAIHKKDDESSPKNYQPISLTCLIKKSSSSSAEIDKNKKPRLCRL